MKGLVIDNLGGNCPVQGEGTVLGVPFYFRARHEEWSMGIGEDPVAVTRAEIGAIWYKSEAWGDGEFAAGWMEREVARGIIESCAALYMIERETATREAEQDGQRHQNL